MAASPAIRKPFGPGRERKRVLGASGATVDQPLAAVRGVDAGGHDLGLGGQAGQGFAADALVPERQRRLARVPDDLGQGLEVRLLVFHELRPPQGEQRRESQDQRQRAGQHRDPGELLLERQRPSLRHCAAPAAPPVAARPSRRALRRMPSACGRALVDVEPDDVAVHAEGDHAAVPAELRRLADDEGGRAAQLSSHRLRPERVGAGHEHDGAGLQVRETAKAADDQGPPRRPLVLRGQVERVTEGIVADHADADRPRGRGRAGRPLGEARELVQERRLDRVLDVAGRRARAQRRGQHEPQTGPAPRC